MQAALARTRSQHPGVRGGLPYVLALQLDRSQNHLARFETALNAYKMRKGRGFVKAGHQRATHWPRRPIDLRVSNCLADGSCLICRDACARDPDGTGPNGTLQTIGLKGLVVVLTERGYACGNKSAPELAEILAQHDDFKNEQSGVQHILTTAGHVGFFGAVCHPELAFIEHKWAHIKAYLRGKVDDTEKTLRVELMKAFSQDSVNVAAMRADARHCRDAMHAYRLLRGADSPVTPEEVKRLVAVQKGHRMPYASVVAGLVAAAAVPRGDVEALRKAAQTQALRRSQKEKREKRKAKDMRKSAQVDRRLKYARQREAAADAPATEAGAPTTEAGASASAEVIVLE